MANNTGKHRSVGLGKALLGEAAFKRESARASTAAIVLGPMLLGRARSVEEQAKVPVAPGAAHKPALHIGAPPIPPAEKKQGGMSEQHVREMLKADPNNWDKVLAVETTRPDGIRPAVARAILAVKDLATVNVVPEEIVGLLTPVAGAPAKKAAPHHAAPKKKR